jgi:hypothetical protein
VVRFLVPGGQCDRLPFHPHSVKNAHHIGGYTMQLQLESNQYNSHGNFRSTKQQSASALGDQLFDDLWPNKRSCGIRKAKLVSNRVLGE